MPSAAIFSCWCNKDSFWLKRSITQCKTAMVAEGLVESNFSKASCEIRKVSLSETATTVAERGAFESKAISPMISPGLRTSILISEGPDCFWISNSPLKTTKAVSPGSPCFISASPARKETGVALSTICCSSWSDRPSKSGDLRRP